VGNALEGEGGGRLASGKAHVGDVRRGELAGVDSEVAGGYHVDIMVNGRGGDDDGG
jgi:hypothetical protein